MTTEVHDTKAPPPRATANALLDQAAQLAI